MEQDNELCWFNELYWFGAVLNEPEMAKLLIGEDVYFAIDALLALAED